MDFREFLKENNVYLDGSTGTLLQAKGLKAGEHPEMWNITAPETVIGIHKAYFDAGSNVVNTNTFGANLLNFSKTELEEIISRAVENAKKARQMSTSTQPKFIALDIGPSGRLLKPYGDFDFEQAVSLFAETVKIGVDCGVDLITIETMNDCYETKAALLAVKENCSLPVIVSNAYSEDGKLMTGASPQAMVAMLEGMGADAIGANCSLGPKQLSSVVEAILNCASVPVILKPNAGLPKSVNKKTVFDVSAKEFACEVAALMKKGVSVVGGCCGTTDEYIKALKELTKDYKHKKICSKGITAVSSYTHAVEFKQEPVLIGERINPTGKKRFKQALLEGDIDYILNEGIAQQEKGVHILDVNVGLPDIDEKEMLCKSVFELQAIIDLPLQIDTSNIKAMEAALRLYNGKAMINSVNGKRDSMQSIFPLAKKYGGVIVALTLDENGIPATAEGRVEIARKILNTAKEYKIDKKDIIFDTLAMAVSADASAAKEALKALKIIKNELGCHTILGVSNISFGLPVRDAVNGAFFCLGLENGLSAAIMNPYSQEMLKTYYTYRLLKGMDENCLDYISASKDFETAYSLPQKAVKTQDDVKPALQSAIIKGLKEQAKAVTCELIETCEPMDIIKNEIIPALDTVAVGFENKTVYLPQLLMSAEAAKSAFEAIKSAVLAGEKQGNSGAKFVLATVKGDIHDIGKNIVKLLLENYGFEVIDLGKDVQPQLIAQTVVKLHAPLAGLSALMTTTVPAMEETIRLIKQSAPWCKIVVGGAVLNKDYAQKIGADKYAKDAMETVRYAEKIIAD